MKSGIERRLLPIVTEVRLGHDENATAPRLITLLGIAILERAVQLIEACNN